MDLRLLEKSDQNQFIGNLIDHFRVEGVTRKNNAFVYDTITSPEALCLDFDCTRYPPKKYFLPPKETLLRFSLKPIPQATPVFAVEPFILFGIHPYDLKAIGQMDRIFSNGTPDPNYLKRREAAILIGIDPKRIAPRSFWADMGAALDIGGFDLMFTDIGEEYAIEIGSERGEALIASHAKTKTADSGAARKRITQQTRMLNLSHVSGLTFPSYEIPALLERSRDNPIWGDLAAKCLSCGSCNMVCPTCYCFDVKDEMDLDLDHGTRNRQWDGCVLKDFAKVGSGENFRESRAARFRHRFYRKGLFLQKALKDLACVGCGRCASACLSDIADPVRVFNQLMES